MGNKKRMLKFEKPDWLNSLSDFFARSFRNRKAWLIAVIAVIILIGTYFILRPAIHRQIENRRIRKNILTCESLSGMSWCNSSLKCFKTDLEFCSDASNALISDLKNNTGVIFQDKGEGSFAWTKTLGNRETEDVNLKGEIYTVSGLKMEDVKRIETYLQSISKEERADKIDGLSGGLRGYYYGRLACTLDFRYKEMHTNEEGLVVPVTDSLNVKFKCGTFNPAR
jgi:hypothetical protein